MHLFWWISALWGPAAVTADPYLEADDFHVASHSGISVSVTARPVFMDAMHAWRFTEAPIAPVFSDATHRPIFSEA